ncbi:hypothetical protein D3C81_922300 [compost metagenome]
MRQQFSTEPSGQATEQQSDDDRRQPHPWRIRAVKQNDRQQHKHAQRQIARRTEVRRVEATAQIGDADLDQADANEGDDDPGHQRRNHATQLTDEAAENDLHDCAEKAHTENHRQNVFRAAAALLDQKTSGEHRTEKGETGALQTDHSRADPEWSPRLNKRADARDHQGHADQIRQMRSQPEGRADH